MHHVISMQACTALLQIISDMRKCRVTQEVIAEICCASLSVLRRHLALHNCSLPKFLTSITTCSVPRCKALDETYTQNTPPRSQS